jgi:hypothetical protein
METAMCSFFVPESFLPNHLIQSGSPSAAHLWNWPKTWPSDRFRFLRWAPSLTGLERAKHAISCSGSTDPAKKVRRWEMRTMFTGETAFLRPTAAAQPPLE